MSENTQVLHLVIRVPKEESAFFYFQLEANEGLCFYSTLPASVGQAYRDIVIKADTSLKEDVLRLIKKLEEKIPMEYLTNEII